MRSPGLWSHLRASLFPWAALALPTPRVLHKPHHRTGSPQTAPGVLADGPGPRDRPVSGQSGHIGISLSTRQLCSKHSLATLASRCLFPYCWRKQNFVKVKTGDVRHVRTGTTEVPRGHGFLEVSPRKAGGSSALSWCHSSCSSGRQGPSPPPCQLPRWRKAPTISVSGGAKAAPHG